ncbi:MAG: hypothetical protein QXM56_01250 [Acidilobaceae archaeon]
MELVVELEPVKSREKLEKRIKLLAEVADWIDVPDSPLGTTRFFSPIVSCFIKAVEERIGVISHIRLLDLNKLAFESMINTLSLCEVERVVPLRGDLISGYKVVEELNPEEAVSLIKKSAHKLSPGLLLSLSKPLEEIERRLRVPADFYLVLNFRLEESEKFKAVSERAKTEGKALYPYVIVVKEEGGSRIPKELVPKALTKERVLEVIEYMSNNADGVLLSSPGDFALLLDVAKELRRRL